MTIGCKMKKKP